VARLRRWRSRAVGVSVVPRPSGTPGGRPAGPYRRGWSGYYLIRVDARPAGDRGTLAVMNLNVRSYIVNWNRVP
jgi:hypothetical protein